MPVAAFLRVHHRLGGIGLAVGKLGLLAVVPLLYRPQIANDSRVDLCLLPLLYWNYPAVFENEITILVFFVVQLLRLLEVCFL